MIFTLNQTQRAELASHIYFFSPVARKTQQPCLRDTVSRIKDTYAFAKLVCEHVFVCVCVCVYVCVCARAVIF